MNDYIEVPTNFPPPDRTFIRLLAVDEVVESYRYCVVEDAGILAEGFSVTRLGSYICSCGVVAGLDDASAAIRLNAFIGPLADFGVALQEAGVPVVCSPCSDDYGTGVPSAVISRWMDLFCILCDPELTPEEWDLAATAEGKALADFVQECMA